MIHGFMEKSEDGSPVSMIMGGHRFPCASRRRFGTAAGDGPMAVEITLVLVTSTVDTSVKVTLCVACGPVVAVKNVVDSVVVRTSVISGAPVSVEIKVVVRVTQEPISAMHELTVSVATTVVAVVEKTVVVNVGTETTLVEIEPDKLSAIFMPGLDPLTSSTA